MWEIFIEQELRFGAGFGPVGITEKKDLGRLWATLKAVFSYFHEQKIDLKIFQKYPSAHTKKLHKTEVRKPPQIFKKFSYKL